MAMLHCLLRLREQGAVRTDFVVGHVNHRLRGSAADRDQQFVEEYASGQGLQVLSRVVDVPAHAKMHKLSTETAGRMLRIRMLSEMTRQCGADAVATAHHRDDEAETMIHRLRRGTGFRGLCGIRPRSLLEGMQFIRPLLGVKREEILTYCKEMNLPWREDHTNTDCGYTRNHIRHKLLPYLQGQIQTDVPQGLADLSEKCRHLFRRMDVEIKEKMQKIVQSQKPDLLVLSRAALMDCTPIVLGEILRRCLIQLEVGLRDYTSQHYQQIMQSLYHADWMKSKFPGNIDCVIDDQVLSFRKATSSEKQIPDEPIQLEIGAVCRFGPFEISSILIESDPDSPKGFKKEKISLMERLDADKINGSIWIRPRRPGDHFRPLGMKTGKKVGKFLTAARINPDMKDKIFIIEDSEKILWVAPVRISECVKVTLKTRHILQVSIKQ